MKKLRYFLSCTLMNRMNSTTTQRGFVVALFILVFITFSLAQRDSKRLDRLYTLATEKKGNVATLKNTIPVQPHLK